MKKVFLGVLALMFLTVISCKEATDKAKEGEENVEEVAEETAEKVEETTEEVAENVEATGDVPTFSDPAVQEYVNAYEEYIAEYTKIVESKDMTAFAGLSQKGQDLATKAQDISGKLTGEDAKLWTDYMTASSKKMQELAAKMTAQ
ncbi:hypothetical protein [Aquimarina algicola]|uniref:hypothetical protein n=1 Tax=Aquimarina algicola TaxID=2589995 RepID=UPI001CF5EB70|nr:hypothetical protein [Aquimarina algicola]